MKPLPWQKFSSCMEEVGNQGRKEVQVYFYRNLVRHLKFGKRMDLVEELLLNIDYWMEKVKWVNVADDLLSDFEYLGVDFHLQKEQEVFKWLYGALRLCKEIVVEYPNELPSQLLGRITYLDDYGCNEKYQIFHDDSRELLLQEGEPKTLANEDEDLRAFVNHIENRQRDQKIQWLIPINRLTGLKKPSHWIEHYQHSENIKSMYMSSREDFLLLNCVLNGKSVVYIFDRFLGTMSPMYIKKEVTSMAMALNDTRIYIVCGDLERRSTMYIYDRVGNFLRVLDKPFYKAIQTIEVDHDNGEIFISVGTMVSCVNSESFEVIQSFVGGHNQSIQSITFNNKYLITGGKDNYIVKWDRKTGSKLTSISTGYSYSVNMLAIPNQEEIIYSVETNRYYVDAWNRKGDHSHFFMDRGEILAIAVNKKGSRLYCAVECNQGTDSNIWIWDCLKVKKLSRINIGARLTSMCLHNNFISTIDRKNRILLHEIHKNHLSPEYDDHHFNAVRSIGVYSQDEKNYILSFGEGENHVYVFDLNGVLLRKPEIFEPIDCGVFMKVHPILIAYAKDTFEIRCHEFINSISGRCVWKSKIPEDSGLVSLIYAEKEDKYLVCVCDEIIHCITYPDGNITSGYRQDKELVISVAVKQEQDDQCFLLTGSLDGDFRVWDVETGTIVSCISARKWRRLSVSCLYIISDFEFLIAGSNPIKWIGMKEGSFPLELRSDSDYTCFAICEGFLVCGNKKGQIIVLGENWNDVICTYTMESSISTIYSRGNRLLVVGCENGRIACLLLGNITS